MKRSLRHLFAVAFLTLLSACAGIVPEAYQTEKPVLELDRYFTGTVDAWGMFTDREGKVVKRFTVVIIGTWNGDTGTLDEDFSYSDGTREKRIWTIRKTGPGRYLGTAGDVVGAALGSAAGNALNCATYLTSRSATKATMWISTTGCTRWMTGSCSIARP